MDQFGYPENVWEESAHDNFHRRMMMEGRFLLIWRNEDGRNEARFRRLADALEYATSGRREEFGGVYQPRLYDCKRHMRLKIVSPRFPWNEI